MRVLYVCATAMEATALAHRLYRASGDTLGRPRRGLEWTCSPGGVVPSMPFDRIVVLAKVFGPWHGEEENGRRLQWYAESVLVRLSGPDALEVGR